MCGTRRLNSALPANPASKPYKPQDTAVIGISNRIVLPISQMLGEVVPTSGFVALRTAIATADAIVARMAANTLDATISRTYLGRPCGDMDGMVFNAFYRWLAM
jgi:hypothetical protein